jgi:leader peptidase (prepilin peptidase)/N-methyltransferase
MTVPAVLAGMFGAIVGSFLNVVVHRLPRGEPLGLFRKSRSRCPRCDALIRWYDNVPLLSYLALLGRCRACKGRISLRYPAVEAVTAGLFALTAVRVLTVGWQPELPAFLLVASWLAVLIAAAAIDLREKILPDALTLRAGPVLALLAALTVPALSGTDLFGVELGIRIKPGLASLLVGLSGLVVGGGTILAVRWIGGVIMRREAMGLGDVKFMAMCGLMLGPVGVLLAIGLGLLSGAVLGLAIWGVTRNREIPFGPFLALGAAAVLLYGEPIRTLLFEVYPAWVVGH